MRHGYHYTRCKGDHGSPVAFLLIVAAVAAVVFWPTVVAVAATVALVVKLTLIVLAAVTVLAAAVTVGMAARRHRRSKPGASMVAVPVRPARRDVDGQLVAEQLAALTAAVNRLADERGPVWSTLTPSAGLDQQTLALLAGLSRLADQRTDEARRRELADRWDGR